MSFGDAAKAALSKAVEALQAIAEVKAIVQHMAVSISKFEERIDRKCEALETRIRELERENAKLHGRVESAYADALTTVLLDRSRERNGSSDGAGEAMIIDRRRERGGPADGQGDSPRQLPRGSLPEAPSLGIK